MGSRRRRGLALAALPLLAALVYLNSLGGDFVWDDRFLVLNNPRVQSVRHLPDLLTSDYVYVAETNQAYGYFRPLSSLSMVADWAIWRADPRGFHLTNVLLHAAAALLAALLAARLGLDRAAAWAVGALFAVHPIHTESVAWIAGRTDVLAFLLAAAAFAVHLGPAGRKQMARPGWWREPTAVLLFALALLAKEMAAVLPLWIAAWEALQEREGSHRLRRALRTSAPYFGALALYALVRFVWLDVPAPAPPPEHGPLPALLTLPVDAGPLPRLDGGAVRPPGLRPEPVCHRPRRSPPPRRAPGARRRGLGDPAPRTAAARGARHRRAARPLLRADREPRPHRGPRRHGRADGRAFLLPPLLSLPRPRGARRRGRPRPGLRARPGAPASGPRSSSRSSPSSALRPGRATGTGATTPRSSPAKRSARRRRRCSGSTSRRRSCAAAAPPRPTPRCAGRRRSRPSRSASSPRARSGWSSPAASEEALPIQRRVASDSERNAVARANLAFLLRVSGRLDEARPILEELTAALPDYPAPFFNLAELHRSRGEWGAAAQAWRPTSTCSRTILRGIEGLASAEVALGRIDRAEEAYLAGLRGRPADARLLNNLGLVRLGAGDLPGAIDALESATRVDPRYDKARYNLASVLVRAGRSRESRVLLEALVAGGAGSETGRAAADLLRTLNAGAPDAVPLAPRAPGTEESSE